MYIMLKGHCLGVVDRVPCGYIIVPLDEGALMDGMMKEGCILIGKPLDHQTLTWNISIDRRTLKALKCDGADVLLDALGYGMTTIDIMEKYISENNNYIADKMRKAIPYMRRLKRE